MADSNKKPNRLLGDNAQSALAYSSLGLQIAIIVGGFAYFGSWLDDKYPSNKKWFTLFFVLLGVAVAIYSAISQLKQINDRHKK